MSNFNKEEVLIVEVPHQANSIAYFIDRQDFSTAIFPFNPREFKEDPACKMSIKAQSLSFDFQTAVDYVSSVLGLSSIHVLSSRAEAKTFLENFRGHGSVSAICAVEKMLGISKADDVDDDDDDYKNFMGTPVKCKNKPTYLNTVSGLDFYEHGDRGDESQTLVKWGNKFYWSGFREIPELESANELKTFLSEFILETKVIT